MLFFRFTLGLLLITTLLQPAISQEKKERILTGAEQYENYKSWIEGKKIGIIANHTSFVGEMHLVDFLIEKGHQVEVIFAPEHGFRGEASDGAKIKDGKDVKTGIPIKSLYGKTRKPTSEMMENVEVLVFDIQDVGARFYTFISTMHYGMEAAAEHNIPFIVLDRPNPNGNYVDGPVRDEKTKSFVGMHQIPIVHGMTVGELAMMINGEEWLEGSLKVDLHISQLKNYTHQSSYSLPIAPSPNLPNDIAIALYPSLCLFEGTVISVGRGTELAFQQIGDPSFKNKYNYSFQPVSMPGKSENPKHKGSTCYGIDLSKTNPQRSFDLTYLLKFYELYSDKKSFFIGSFTRLAGTESLQKQIEMGWTEEKIRASWEPALSQYKKMRLNYLIYPLK